MSLVGEEKARTNPIFNSTNAIERKTCEKWRVGRAGFEEKQGRLATQEPKVWSTFETPTLALSEHGTMNFASCFEKFLSILHSAFSLDWMDIETTDYGDVFPCNFPAPPPPRFSLLLFFSRFEIEELFMSENRICEFPISFALVSTSLILYQTL